MSKKQILLYRGDAFQSGGSGRFAKDVIKDGNWIHPATGKPVVVTAERRQRLAANTQKLLDGGTKIPFRDGHRNDAKANLGYWPGPVMAHGDAVIAMVEPTDKEALGKMRDGSIADVSVVIEFDYTDSKGQHFDEVITAIDATSFPVITGQKRFLEFSRSAEERGEDIYIHEKLAGILPEGKEKRMDPKKLALALGLPEDSDEAKIMAALQQREVDLKASAEKAKAFEGLSAIKPQELQAHGLELKDGKVVKLTVVPNDEPASVKALREELEAMKKAQALSSHEALQKAVESRVLGLQLPPAGKAITDRMLARVNQAQTLMLSSQSAEGVKNVAKIMEDTGKDLVELLGTLPKQGQKLSSEPSDSEKAAEELSQKKSDEIVERTQGKPAAKK